MPPDLRSIATVAAISIAAALPPLPAAASGLADGDAQYD